MGLARSIFYRVLDRAAVVLAASLTGGDGSISRPKAPSWVVGGHRLACDQLENRWHRSIAFHHDDGQLLPHHSVYADVWHRSVAPDQPSKPVGHFLRGHVEFFLAASGWRHL